MLANLLSLMTYLLPLLKKVASEIAGPLENLFNQSLHDTMIPVARKQSHITIVYNRGKCDIYSVVPICTCY